MHCSRHAKTKGGQGMTHGMPKQVVAKAWQADCLSPGKAMRCSWHAKTRGAKAWQADCLSPGKAMHCSWHAHGMWQDQARCMPRHDSRHAKKRGTHGMPKKGVAKVWQTDCFSTGKAMCCSWHKACIAECMPKHGKPYHRARQSIMPKEGLAKANRLLVTGQGNALLTACQNKVWPSKMIACHRARQCSTTCQDQMWPWQEVAKEWQVDCLYTGQGNFLSALLMT
ncbi:hypothetical protein RHGRI_010932 [Rhododendron griersonianum]|uniref:Uncharacterized protein n=1 Tax=Rhododendron griersonianum TaxID=479676 RepID=A0AAV6KKW3_9ERIC|nr:hypothetical protein RHGRI_010932 [Rhododendron griersonianum]